MRGLLVVVSGPSGVGKGTLLATVLARRSDCVFSISATTRDPRPGEIHGRHYHFLDHSTFTAWVEQGRFLEWNKVFDQFYGTPREYVELQRSKGLNVILDVDVQGGMQVMEAEPEDHLSIFICPPDLETLRQRLTLRNTETPEQIQKRLLTARVELRSIDHYRYTVVNNDVDHAAANLESIIVAESSRTQRLREGGRFAPLHGRDLMSDEWVDLVDEQNQLVGKATRSEVRQKNLPHRGIAVLVCNSQGQVYVHQRTARKDLFPSMFDMFVGGVVSSGESYEEAVRREAFEELGVGASDFEFLFDHLFKSDKNYSWIRLFRTVWDGPVQHQASEIAWGQWMDESLLEEWTHQVEIVPDGLEVFERYLEFKRSA